VDGTVRWDGPAVVRPHRRPSGSPATVAAANWRTGRGDFGVGGRTPAAHRTV